MRSEQTPYRPPCFDEGKAPDCKAGYCGIGNAQLPPERRQCTYMEQTRPLDSGITGAQLASDPGYAGWMRELCPFGEEVYEIRTQNNDK